MNLANVITFLHLVEAMDNLRFWALYAPGAIYLLACALEKLAAIRKPKT